MRATRSSIPALAAALLVATVGCSDTGGEPDRPAVLVFAAASLTDAFADIESAFEESHPGIEVQVATGASSALREQILAGAPADVFASADHPSMETVVAAGAAAGDPLVYAINRMAIAVPAGNPAAVTGLGDLADSRLMIGLCAPQVPCGDLGRRVLGAAGIEASPDTDEPNVRALLTKVEVGELDAGLVYVTDVLASEIAEGIAIPAEWNRTNEYPISVLDGAGPGAVAFVDFVLSEAGRGILADHGFGVP